LDTLSESVLTGTFSEEIHARDFLSVYDQDDPLSFDGLRKQVLDGMAGLPGLPEIEVIVTTKGLPLRIDSGANPDPDTYPKWKSFSSLESELTRIDSIDTITEMGNQHFLIGLPQFDRNLSSNPYYNQNGPFVRTGSDPVNGDIRLSARLDGYSLQTVKETIDRAQKTFVVPYGQFLVADDDPTADADQMVDTPPGEGGGGPGPGLVNVAISSGQSFLYENTNAARTSAPGPVIGYVSHGTNDGSGGLESGYIENQLQFQLANGAIFLTHESWNARSFAAEHSQTQGLIAEWLEIGGTAGLGHVHEPLNGPDNVTNEDLLYQMLLPDTNAAPGESGHTFVEAAWNATRQLSYVNTVVGDPLMRWQQWLPGDANLDGEVEFDDFFILQANWYGNGSFAEGDFNGDGTIDEIDFQILDNNWLTDGNFAAQSPSTIVVQPIIDPKMNVPALSAISQSVANFDGDIDVDGGDAAIWASSLNVDAGGDSDADGDTDGADFLNWQRQHAPYTFTADFDLNAEANAEDLAILQASYGTNMGGDADRDADTDGYDFLAWQREYSAPFEPSQSAVQLEQVPEPGAGEVLLAALVLLLLWQSVPSLQRHSEKATL
jgi:uncharacterized protein (TIGR03790 family)